MAETIQRKLNDSSAARWTALLLIASTMFFGYMFVDLMSPLQSMIEAQRGWTPDVFGMYGSSEFILNVFGFLILAGIILDKMGVRFTGQLSASLMFIGACLKYYAVSDSFAGSGIETWLGSWWTSFPASAKLASLGFMIFGCGMEIEEDEELSNLALAALAPALAREVLRLHKGLPAPSRGMTPAGAVWYLAGPIGDIRATSGGHVVMFGHGHEHHPFRVVLTSTEAEAIAGALLAAAHHTDGNRWAAMDTE